MKLRRSPLWRDLRQTSSRSLRLVRWRLWQGRLVVWLAAALLGLTLIGFSLGVDASVGLFYRLRDGRGLLPFLITPPGGMLVVYLTRRYFAGAEGSGIPQVIAALKAGDNQAVQGRLVSLRIAVGKMLLAIAALFCGFSSGKEGPSVQIGASIMMACRRFLPDKLQVRSEYLLLAGGAAGITVAFNTPIAGIVFAIEELGRKFDRRTNIVLLSTIMVAGAIAVAFKGNFPYFGRLELGDGSHQLLLPILVMGVAGGVCGGVFGRLMVLGSHPTLTFMGRWRAKRPVLFAGACGLAVAVLGYVSGGLVHGGGYTVTRDALASGTPLPFAYALEKMAATLLSYFSGIPGGIFAPCLSIGAAMGQDMARLASSPDMDMWMALGMVAFLAGVTQVPLTAFVIVMEMIDGHAIVISLMSVALLANIIARIFSQSPYHALARQFLFQARQRAREEGQGAAHKAPT